MAVLDNTSGHLQLGHVRIIIHRVSPVVHVTLPVTQCHHLLETITSVSLDMYMVVVQRPHSTPMTFSGMEETVTPPVHVVLSTILHISPKPSTRQLPMTWN